MLHHLGNLSRHVFEYSVQNRVKAVGFTGKYRGKFRTKTDHLGIFGFDFGIQCFCHLNGAPADVFKKSLGRAFDQIQRCCRIQQQTTLDIRKMSNTQNRPCQLSLCRPSIFTKGTRVIRRNTEQVI